MTPTRILRTIDFFKKKQDEEAEFISNLWLEFGKEIRRERKVKKIKLESFAADLGISGTMVSYLESGKRGWTFAMARKAVKLLSQ